MRAVNLIPADLRRGGGGGAGGRSGGAVYIIIGALAVLVVLGIVYGLTAHKVADRKNQIAATTREADLAAARAAALQPYVQIDSRRTQRETLIATLAAKRFNWSLAMRQIAKALPTDAVLTKMSGNNSPSSGGAAGGGGGSGALRGQLPVPAIELTGCSRSQPRVAAAIDSLRRIPGVQVVSLGSSTKPGQAGGGASSTNPGTSSCGTNPPSFDVVVYYTDASAPGAPLVAAAFRPTGRETVLR